MQFYWRHHVKIEKREVKKRSFNAQIEFTMHEMKCFMILCEKLMTAEKRRGWKKKKAKQSKKSFKNSIWSEKKEIEFINIDTDGKDFYFDSSIVHFFPLTLLWLCYPISKFFFYSLYISLDDDDGLLACLLTCRVVFLYSL